MKGRDAVLVLPRMYIGRTIGVLFFDLNWKERITLQNKMSNALPSSLLQQNTDNGRENYQRKSRSTRIK